MTPYSIDIFTALGRCVILKGWVAATGELDLLMPDGEVVPVPGVSLDGINTAFDFQGMVSTDAPYGARLRVTAAENVWTIDNLAVTEDPAHALFSRFLSMLQGEGEFLEIGSRARSGVSRRSIVPADWRYTGFDIIDGENVDVVGDAHELSEHFPQQFDAVMALSVLEHILMPWKMAVELNRVLKVGALGFFMTHQAWPIHDAPWDFWRFSDQSWRAILNPGTGFEIIEAQMGEPTYIVPQRLHAVTAFGMSQHSYLASGVLFRKISDTQLDWPVKTAEIVSTSYPSTTGVVAG